jgi:membrane protein YdbS with pleckstrin-like domain
MKMDKVPYPPYIPYFVLFGSVGGWILSYTLFIHMWAFGIMIVLAFVLATTLATIISMFIIIIRYKKTIYHNIALAGNIAYILFIGSLYYFVNLSPK